MVKTRSISLCMILKNEAHNLPRLFESIEGCFDDVIIMDTGSTDDTVKLCEQFGARVFHFDWVNDFAKARNECLKYVTTEYWMWMDGDDVLLGKDEFIEWKENLLPVYDMWYATYNYATNAEGLVTTSFLRERVAKTSYGLKFKDPIHEGIFPFKPDGTQVSAGLVRSWQITHVRSETETNADRGRNLVILLDLAAKNKLTCRLEFYLGKEYFDKAVFENENKEGLEKAVIHLTNALKRQELELHDKVAAHQFLSLAHLRLKDFASAEKWAMIGLHLSPAKAELLCVIGDCHYERKNFVAALPWYHAALNCSYDSHSGISPTLSIRDYYQNYPLYRLAATYYSLDKIDSCLIYGAMCPYPEAKVLVQTAQNAKAMMAGDLPPGESDNAIVFLCQGSAYDWDEEIYCTKGLGGSETACVEMAKHLKEITGCKVIVFNKVTDETVIAASGVEYRPISQTVKYLTEFTPVVQILWRHINGKLSKAPSYVWSHDLITPNADKSHMYDHYLSLSNFHKVMSNMDVGVPKEKIIVTRNGIVADRFKNLEIKKQKGLVVWPNSADRGLDKAIAVMDEVVKEIPEAELHVFYGLENLYKYNLGHVADRLKAQFATRPYIVYHGNVEQKVLAQWLAKAEVWLYPAYFIETFCITALEALAAKAWPVVRAIGALRDTLSEATSKGQCDLLDVRCETPEEIALYAKHVIDAINEEKWRTIDIDIEKHDWKNVALEWCDFMKLPLR